MDKIKRASQVTASTLLGLMLPLVALYLLSPPLSTPLSRIAYLNRPVLEGLTVGDSYNDYSPTSVNVTESYTLYLPIVTRPPGRLYGQLLENGVPTAGITITLIWCEKHMVVGPNALLRCDTRRFHTITNDAGEYEFFDMPTLITDSFGLTQTYQVEWRNSDGNPNRLAEWHSRIVSSYTSGEVLNMGNFDIGAITLIAPAAGTTVTFPVDFRWETRANSSTDSYGVCIQGGLIVMPVLPEDSISCNQPLGYINHFELQEPFDGIDYDFYYWWYVQVFDVTGGVGEQYDSIFWFASP